MNMECDEECECSGWEGGCNICNFTSSSPTQSTHHLDVIARMPKAKSYKPNTGLLRVPIEISAMVHTTAKAILVQTKEFGEIWLPTKYIKYSNKAWTIPLWLHNSCKSGKR